MAIIEVISVFANPEAAVSVNARRGQTWLPNKHSLKSQAAL